MWWPKDALALVAGKGVKGCKDVLFWAVAMWIDFVPHEVLNQVQMEKKRSNDDVYCNAWCLWPLSC